MNILLKRIIILMLIIITSFGVVLPTNVVFGANSITVYRYMADESDLEGGTVVLEEVVANLQEDALYKGSYIFTVDEADEQGKYFLLQPKQDGERSTIYGQNKTYSFNTNKSQNSSTPDVRVMDLEGKTVQVIRADGSIEEIVIDPDIVSNIESYNLDSFGYYSLKDRSFTGKNKNQDNKLFEELEEMMAALVRGTANLLIKLINMAVGGSNGITLDDVIFNKYEPTRLMFFNSAIKNELVTVTVNGEQRTDYKNPIIHDISEVIEKWCIVFTEITTTAYLAILLYMGIQILLSSTANRRAEYKRYLIDWVIGLAIMAFSPLLVKYAILMNDDFVASIEKQKSSKFSSSLPTDTPKLNEAPDLNTGINDITILNTYNIIIQNSTTHRFIT